MRKRKTVIVELTSLLDVIFIMLFMVMNKSEAASEAAQKKAEDEIAAADMIVSEMEETVSGYEDILKETEEERNNLANVKNRLESYESFDEYAKILSVYIVDGGYKRSINVAAGEEIFTADYSWDNMDYAGSELKKSLTEHIGDGKTPVFISFSYNGDKIYRQDYNMITEVMTEVQSGYEHVYIRFDDRKDG